MTTPPTWSPAFRIDQALLTLEFAIKVMNYIRLGRIDKSEFDTETIVLLPGGSLNFKHSAFNTYDDIILAAENLFSQAVATSAITMDAALQDAGIRNDPEDNSDRGQARSIVFMIRCAFAHDLQLPKWEVRGPYLNKTLRLRFRGHDVQVDLPSLHGQLFDLPQIGGALVYWDLMHEVRSWLPEEK